MGDVLRSRIADDKRHHLKGWQDNLQERQLHFEGVLSSDPRLAGDDAECRCCLPKQR